MSHEIIRPKDYFSDTPPERIIGSECEYNIQEGRVDNERLYADNYIKPYMVSKIGLKKYGYFLNNGAKLYEDVDHIEYATQESLGPRQAAETDMAGVQLVSRLVRATGLPHHGLFRLTGTFLRDKYTQEQEGETSGYHENYMLPRCVTARPLLDEIIPAHLATRIWAMSGTLREGFVFSQKVWGIGGKPIARKVERMIAHGTKPMAIIPPTDLDTVGNKRWARLEVRYADAGLSPLVRYVGFAATSLVLRLLEYEDVCGHNLANTGFKDPVGAAKMFAEDLTLKQTAELNDGRFVTALNMQEMQLDAVEELGKRIELPESERQAIPKWRDICTRLKNSRPDRGEYNGLEYDLDISAKHVTLLRRHGYANLNRDNPQAMQTTLLWDRILEEGAGTKWWRRYGKGVLDAANVEKFIMNPPPTRAALRSAEMNHGFVRLQNMDWAHFMKRDIATELDDPYKYE